MIKMSTSSQQEQTQSPTLFGHPTGLFTLFFAEMWERFSYYGMRAILIFYMVKGFLGYNDHQSVSVYGAYCALVYATPFFGGMLADRLLGARWGVVLGGLLMAAGHVAMTVENETIFFIALSLLILGNGFFKPNISTIVGTLYPKGSGKKDAGFTIFYMGINLGAAIAPVLCAYVGETVGWHYGFGLATLGMLIGVAIFIAPTRLTQVLILGGALLTAVALPFPFIQETVLQLVTSIMLAISLAIAGILAFVALGRGGLPPEAGGPPSEERLSEPAFPALRKNAITYYLAIIAALLTFNLVATPSSTEAWMFAGVAAAAIVLPWTSAAGAVYVCVAGAVPALVLLLQRNELVGYILLGLGALAFGSLAREAFRAKKIERERMFVVLILMFFSMLFWAFFEQAGSSLNNFTDRNVDRVEEYRTIEQGDIDSEIVFRIQQAKYDEELEDLPLLSQEQLGYPCGDDVFQRVKRAQARRKAEKESPEEKEEDWGPKLARSVEELLKEKRNKNKAEDEPDGKTISLAVSPPSIVEDSKAKLVYTFTRGGEPSGTLTISFEVSGSAEPEKDYKQSGADFFRKKTGSVTIPDGKDSATVTIKPETDTTVEENEKVVLKLVAGPDYKLGKNIEVEGIIENDDKFLTMTHLSMLREEAKREEANEADKTITWTMTKEHVGMGITKTEVPASVFLAANPIFILIFGLVFSALWGFLNARGVEPSTPVKFALGLLQLGLGFAAFWYGAQVADDRGMVLIVWLLLGYLLHTTGELCISPVGLAMVTRLSPVKMVSTVMGAWFLSFAMSNWLASIIAKLTGVSHGGGGEQIIPVPKETVDVYGNVFGIIAITAMVSGVICFTLAPLLTRWMHEGVDTDDDEEPED
jgi:dipeptide/tripeptide permease